MGRRFCIAGDKRRAVRPNGVFLNFGITDNYLGQPCNDPRAVKVCLDFYDDPAFAGLDVAALYPSIGLGIMMRSEMDPKLAAAIARHDRDCGREVSARAVTRQRTSGNGLDGCHRAREKIKARSRRDR